MGKGGRNRSLRSAHWKERLHPRDDRGRFAHKGGGKWLQRVGEQFSAAFGDISLGPRPGENPGRLQTSRSNGFLIDVPAFKPKAPEAPKTRRDSFELGPKSRASSAAGGRAPSFKERLADEVGRSVDSSSATRKTGGMTPGTREPVGSSPASRTNQVERGTNHDGGNFADELRKEPDAETQARVGNLAQRLVDARNHGTVAQQVAALEALNAELKRSGSKFEVPAESITGPAYVHVTGDDQYRTPTFAVGFTSGASGVNVRTTRTGKTTRPASLFQVTSDSPDGMGSSRSQVVVPQGGNVMKLPMPKVGPKPAWLDDGGNHDGGNFADEMRAELKPGDEWAKRTGPASRSGPRKPAAEVGPGSVKGRKVAKPAAHAEPSPEGTSRTTGHPGRNSAGEHVTRSNTPPNDANAQSALPFGSHAAPHADMQTSEREGERVEVRANAGTVQGTIVGQVGGLHRAGNSFYVVRHEDGSFQTYDTRVVYAASTGGKSTKVYDALLSTVERTDKAAAPRVGRSTSGDKVTDRRATSKSDGGEGRRYQTFAERMAGDMTDADRLAAHTESDRRREELRAQEREQARKVAEAQANDTRSEREKLTEQLRQQRMVRDVDMRSGRVNPRREAAIKAGEERLATLDLEDRKAKIKELGISKGDTVKTDLGEFEVTGTTKDGYLRATRPDGSRGAVDPKHVQSVTKSTAPALSPTDRKIAALEKRIETLQGQVGRAKDRRTGKGARIQSGAESQANARLQDARFELHELQFRKIRGEESLPKAEAGRSSGDLGQAARSLAGATTREEARQALEGLSRAQLDRVAEVVGRQQNPATGQPFGTPTLRRGKDDAISDLVEVAVGRRADSAVIERNAQPRRSVDKPSATAQTEGMTKVRNVGPTPNVTGYAKGRELEPGMLVNAADLLPMHESQGNTTGENPNPLGHAEWVRVGLVGNTNDPAYKSYNSNRSLTGGMYVVFDQAGHPVGRMSANTIAEINTEDVKPQAALQQIQVPVKRMVEVRNRTTGEMRMEERDGLDVALVPSEYARREAGMPAPKMLRDGVLDPSDPHYAPGGRRPQPANQPHGPRVQGSRTREEYRADREKRAQVYAASEPERAARRAEKEAQRKADAAAQREQDRIAAEAKNAQFREQYRRDQITRRHARHLAVLADTDAHIYGERGYQDWRPVTGEEKLRDDLKRDSDAQVKYEAQIYGVKTLGKGVSKQSMIDGIVDALKAGKQPDYERHAPRAPQEGDEAKKIATAEKRRRTSIAKNFDLLKEAAEVDVRNPRTHWNGRPDPRMESHYNNYMNDTQRRQLAEAFGLENLTGNVLREAVLEAIRDGRTPDLDAAPITSLKKKR